MTEETNLQTPLPDQPIDGGPETVVDPEETPEEPAEATEGDEILETGGRTDNAGELTEKGESQDPDVEVESDPEAEEDLDG
jgi:hypothetical protein